MSTFQKNLLHNQCELEGLERIWGQDDNDDDEKYRVILKSVKQFKIRNKWTTQRIMVILTPIERETLQVFFFFVYFTDAQCVHLW